MTWMVWVSIGLVIWAVLGSLAIALSIYLNGEVKEKDFDFYFLALVFSYFFIPVYLGILLGRKLRERRDQKPPPFDPD